MGQLYVSASEIEVFDLCPRKWAFSYIENKRPPSNDSAALGTRVHAILEKWLTDGTAPDTWTPEGEIAASGLHLLPAPRTPTLVTEEKFHFASQRAWYTGFKDFRYRDANGLIHVGDHKTTKAFTWAKTVEDILCHPQALIYAVDEFHKNPNDNHLALDWVYYKTTGARKAESRFQIVSRNSIAELFFEHVDLVAGEITKLHHEVPSDASALDFTPDFRACDAFGGCAFLSICNPTPTQRVQATMTQAGMSLTDRLKAMKAGRPPSPIHPPEAFVPPQPVQAAPQPVLPFPQIAPVPPSPPAPSFSQTAPSVPATPFVLSMQATPPAVFTPPVPAPAPVPVVEPTQEAAAPRKPGRPRKKEPASGTIESASAPSAHTVAAPAAPPTGFVLYVGCAPIGCEVTSALIYVNAAHDRLKELHNVAHYQEMEHGKGPGELCKVLEEVLALCETASNAPLGDVVFGNTRAEEDTAGVWISRATKVVRAFR